MTVDDRRWHVLIACHTEGEGVSRRWRYALSDVVLWTDQGNDALADWERRNPGRKALWFVWSALAGAAFMDSSPDTLERHKPPVQVGLTPPGFDRELLRGVTLALRIGSGEFGPCDRATVDHRGVNPHHVGDGAPPDGEMIDPSTLEIKDGD